MVVLVAVEVGIPQLQEEQEILLVQLHLKEATEEVVLLEALLLVQQGVVVEHLL
jgi:hypothetical protein